MKCLLAVVVLSNHCEDVSSPEEWRRTYIRDGMTDHDKAIAIWKTVVRYRHQTNPPNEYLSPEKNVHDPLKTIHVYGYGMCCCATSNVCGLARYLGMKAHGRSITRHTISEVFYDNAWHMIDGSLMNYFRRPDGADTALVPDDGITAGKAAGRPVAVHWTRAEEFTWAYFRPAALIECKGGLDDKGALIAWDFTNINAGGSAIEPPYEIPNTQILSVGSDSPLRQGAYRCLAATANNFARESFMDELAAAAEADPLAFRLARLENTRLRTVLEVAAKRFDWTARRKKITPELSVGLACGTEKNSVVAACVEVGIDRQRHEIKVHEVCEAFECGPVQNPDNLVSQVQGCIMMGMGPALREAMQFEDGKILNAGFTGYQVPRFKDMPKIDVHLVDNTDIPSAGGGETPIIAIAPAIANAVFAATGLRIRSMPIRLPDTRPPTST